MNNCFQFPKLLRRSKVQLCKTLSSLETNDVKFGLNIVLTFTFYPSPSLPFRLNFCITSIESLSVSVSDNNISWKRRVKISIFPVIRWRISQRILSEKQKPISVSKGNKVCDFDRAIPNHTTLSKKKKNIQSQYGYLSLFLKTSLRLVLHLRQRRHSRWEQVNICPCLLSQSRETAHLNK